MLAELLIRRKGDAPGAPPFFRKTFDAPIITIGSEATASLRLSGSQIAPEQAIIIHEDGQMLLINRAEGTILRGERLAREIRRPLKDGDLLHIGEYVISVLLKEAARHAHENVSPESRPAKVPPAGEETFGLQGRRNMPSSPLKPNDLPIPAPASPNGGDAPRNFAAILDSLRTEEDSFYFLVEGGLEHNQRIAIEDAETTLGWDESGQHLSFDPAKVATKRAVLRKDWSGVVVESQGLGMVVVNGEPVESARRLHNGDRLMIVPTGTTAAQHQSILIFHEPASLMVLDSLLPQKLPPPVTLDAPGEPAASLEHDVNPVPAATRRARQRIFHPGQKYFGYFTVLEILLMMAGTLVAAMLIFLVLEYS